MINNNFCFNLKYILFLFFLFFCVSFVFSQSINFDSSKFNLSANSNKVNFLDETLLLSVDVPSGPISVLKLVLANDKGSVIYDEIWDLGTSFKAEKIFFGKVNGKFVSEGEYVFYLIDSSGVMVSNYVFFEVFYNLDFVELSEKDFSKIYPNPVSVDLALTSGTELNIFDEQVIVLDGVFSLNGVNPVFNVELESDFVKVDVNVSDAYFYKKYFYLMNKESLSSEELLVIDYLSSNFISNKSLIRNRDFKTVERIFSKSVLDGLLQKGIIIKRPIFLNVNVNLVEFVPMQNGFVREFFVKEKSIFSSFPSIKYQISFIRNLKDISKFNEFGSKPVFLVSNNDWKEVLQMVPLTTWTGVESSCNRVYDGPSNVCAFPTLVYHSEDAQLNFETNDFGIKLEYKSTSDGSHPSSSPFLSLSNSNEKSDNLQIINNGENIVFGINLFGELTVGSAVLVKFPKELILIGPTSVNFDDDHREAKFLFKVKPGAFENIDKKYANVDVDSVIHFISEYSPSNVVSVGDLSLAVEKVLVAKPELGASLNKSQIKIFDGNVFSFWKKYVDVIYVDDDYSSALIASSFASLINAPLVIKGSNLDIGEYFVNKNVICVGMNTSQCDESYSISELQKKYFELTNTKKFILTNPADFGAYYTGEFLSLEKTSGKVFNLFGDTSLVAPFLAAGKQELIIFTNNFDYDKVEKDLKQKFFDLTGFEEKNFLESCNANDVCAEGVVEEKINYNMSDVNSIDLVVGFDKKKLANFYNKDLILVIKGINSLEKCFKINGSKVFVNVNGKIVTPLYQGNSYSSDFKIPEIVHLGSLYMVVPIDILKECGDSIVLTVGVNNCNIGYDESVLSATLWDTVQSINSYDNDLNKIDLPILNVLGSSQRISTTHLIKSGSTATFNFKGFNPNLNYKVFINALSGFIDLSNKENEFVDRSKKAEFLKIDYWKNLEKSFFKYSIGSGYINSGESIDGGLYIQITPKNDIYFQSVDSFSGDFLDDYYLTILASPESIQITKNPEVEMHHSVDGIYSNFNKQGKTVLYTGRLFGYTVSDISSYLARDFFFDSIYKNKKGAFILRGVEESKPFETYVQDVGAYKFFGNNLELLNHFSNDVFSCFTYHDPERGCDNNFEKVKENFLSSYFVFYEDHGTIDWAFISSYDLKNKYFQPKTSIIIACSTCDYVKAKNHNSLNELFCMQNIRRGDLGYVGAQSPAFTFDALKLAPLFVNDKLSLGKAFYDVYDGKEYFVLIGDPTFIPIYWE